MAPKKHPFNMDGFFEVLFRIEGGSQADGRGPGL